MEEYEINGIEQTVLEVANRECKSADVIFVKIQDRLITNEARQKIVRTKRNRFRIAFTSVAASFFILFGIGISVYLASQGNIPNYTYGENDIVVRTCTANELTDIYLPDLSILTETQYQVGEHKETGEIVYFRVIGKFYIGGNANNVEMLLIMQPQYSPLDEPDYNTNNVISIVGKEISLNEFELEYPTYLFKLGLCIDNIRYYVDFTILEKGSLGGELGSGDISEKDICELFLKIFIK